MSAEFSLGYLSFPDATAVELINAAAENNVRYVSLRIAGRTLTDTGLWPAYVSEKLAEVSHHLHEKGVEVFSVTGPYISDDFSIDAFLPILKAARTLDCHWLFVSNYDTDFERCCHHLTALAVQAKTFDVGIGIEFVPYSHTKNLHEANALVDAVSEERLSIVLDAMHFVRSGGTVADLRSMNRKRICTFQLCDGAGVSPFPNDLAREARGYRLPPGKGMFPLQEMRAAIATETMIELEIPVSDQQALPISDASRNLIDECRQFLT